MLFRPVMVQWLKARLFATGLSFTMLMCALFPGDSLGRDTTIFQQFTQHIGRQIHKDKQAFAQANTCVENGEYGGRFTGRSPLSRSSRLPPAI